jgi:hypothetical protein
MAYFLLITKDILLVVISAFALWWSNKHKDIITNKVARTAYLIYMASPCFMVIQQHIAGGLTWW